MTSSSSRPRTPSSSPTATRPTTSRNSPPSSPRSCTETRVQIPGLGSRDPRPEPSDLNSDVHPALGIDHGDARIGIAATDPLGILAHPVETLEVRTADPLQRIAALVAERHIRTLVLGLPLNLDGEEGPAAEKVRAFGEKLSAHLPELPLVYIDESHTTVAAATKLREAGRSAKRQKGIIDQAAAVEILRLWMATLPGATPEPPADGF